MSEIPQGWSGDDQRISKVFKFNSFAEALAFMVEVGLYCERADHHPSGRTFTTRYWVELTTHDAGRVTEKDLASPQHMDKVFSRRSG